MSLLGWKQKWRGPVPVGWPTRGGALGVRCPVVGSNLNWKMALGPPRLSMWGTKANVLEGSVWIAWAPMAVSNHSIGGRLPRRQAQPGGPRHGRLDNRRTAHTGQYGRWTGRWERPPALPSRSASALPWRGQSES